MQSEGHLFSGRYKALVVDGSGPGYLRTVCDYVHLNPVRAKLLKPEQRLLEYPWSSFGFYLAAPPHRPAWLRVDRLLGEHGIGKDTAAGRLEFERRMEARRAEEADEESLKALRRAGQLQERERQITRLDASQRAMRHAQGREPIDGWAGRRRGRFERDSQERHWQENEENGSYGLTPFFDRIFQFDAAAVVVAAFLLLLVNPKKELEER